MYGILLVTHVIVAICLVGLILIQHGKGAQTGAAFGSGASTTLFGSQGTGGFLSRTTAILATMFFLLNLIIGYVVNSTLKKQSMPSTPVAPVSAPQTEIPDHGTSSTDDPSSGQRSSEVPTTN